MDWSVSLGPDFLRLKGSSLVHPSIHNMFDYLWSTWNPASVICEFVTIQQIGCHIAVWQQLRPEFASLFRLCDSLKQLQPADQVVHLLRLFFLVMTDSFPYLSICFLLVTQRVVWFSSIDIVRVGARSRPQHSNAQWGVLAWKSCFNGSIWRKNEWTSRPPKKYVNDGFLVWTSQFSLKILKPKLGLSDGYPGTPNFFSY